MKKHTLLIIILGLAANFANAQFTIKIPKITKPKIETPKTAQTPEMNNPDPVRQNSSSKISTKRYDRQLKMDDGFTYFDAEHVSRYASNSLKDQDLGWYMRSHLRLLGTFPERSAFRVVVKKNGRELSSVRCEGDIYTKAKDENLRNDVVRRNYSLNYDDYMTTNLQCFDKDAVNKETGKMDVEVYFINGDTDAEQIVRTYKIDVHRATNVRGNAKNPQQDVPSYYIQRHAETGVAFAYFDYGTDRNGYFKQPVERFDGSGDVRTLRIYSTFSPQSGKSMPNSMFTRCTVNGQRIDFTGNYDRDSVQRINIGRRDEIGSYTDRLIPQYQRGNPYVDKVVFKPLVFEMPIYSVDDTNGVNYLLIEDNPGNWECSIISNGETLRTFRWKVAGGKIVPHAEQQSGNVNLFYDAALIEMEIPEGGASFDHRLTPMPNAGLFYGIPWTSADGREMAAGVPKKGNPYHVPSNKVQ